MQPNIVLNWAAIVVSVIAAFFLGFLWYGPLFGKMWAKGMGMKMDQKVKPRVMQQAMALQVLGTFLTSYVLAYSLNVWRPSVWGLAPDASSCHYAFCAAVFTWLGFFVPMQLTKVGWEMKPWRVFFINAGHDFLKLQMICFILAYWR